jgi:hypothetical protein
MNTSGTLGGSASMGGGTCAELMELTGRVIPIRCGLPVWLKRKQNSLCSITSYVSIDRSIYN